MTTSEHHARVMELFNEAAERPAAERAAFLDRECADSAVRLEVESLLSNDEPGTFLNRSVIPGLDLARLAGLDMPEPAALPDQIGEFKVLGVLGSGGMGIVYHALQASPAREVALKLIRPGLATPGARRRFETEIQALARLRHPGIAAIHAAATINTPAGPQPYLVMEYVRGMPLLKYASEHALLHRDRVNLMAQLCDAIQYAHQQGVIHRDLKPANILVEFVDGIPRPRVLDFGIARLMDRSSAATVTTIPGHVVGTLAYMSPEQADGDPQAADTRSDVYSLGAVAYELLCGKVPIDISGASTLAAIKVLRESTPKPLAVHDPALRGDLEIILSKALAKDLEQRYASAGELAADLRHYLNNEPILARKPTLLYTARKFTERHRLLVGSTTLILIVLVAGIAGTVYGLVQARQSSERLQAQVRDTSETASYLVQDVLANLGTISGTDAIRMKMLEQLGEQVDRLLVQTPGDPALVRARATILTQRSDMELAKGDCTKALELRHAALDLYKSLAAAASQNAEQQSDVSIALVKIGDVYKERHDRHAEKQWYTQAFVIDQHLVLQHPDSVHFADNLAWSYHRLAELALDECRFDDADRLLQEVETVGKRLQELKPDRPLTTYLHWQTQHAIARVAGARNDPETAKARYEQAFNTAKQLVAREPDNRDYAIASASSLLGLARPGWMATADVAQAMDDAIKSMRQFHAKDRHDVRMLRLLCTALLNRSVFACDTGDPAAAARACEETLELIAQADAGQARELNIASIREQIGDLLPRARRQLASQVATAPAL